MKYALSAVKLPLRLARNLRQGTMEKNRIMLHKMPDYLEIEGEMALYSVSHA